MRKNKLTLVICCIIIMSAVLTLGTEAAANITASISIDPASYSSSAWVYLNVAVTNNGTTAAEGLVLQRGATIRDRHNIGTLRPGETQTIQLTYQIVRVERVSFQVVDEYGAILTTVGIDINPTELITAEECAVCEELPPETTAQQTLPPPETATQSPPEIVTAEPEIDWWGAQQTETADNFWTNTAAAVQAETSTSTSDSENPYADLAIINGFPVFGWQYLEKKPPMRDFPLESIILFPAIEGRGDFILVNNKYYGNVVDNATNIGKTDKSGGSGSISGNVNGKYDELGLTAITALQTGQKTDWTIVLLIAGISAFMLISGTMLVKKTGNK